MTKKLCFALALLLAAPTLLWAQKDAMTVTVKDVSFKMIRVKGGTFTMGATAEQCSDTYDPAKPAHKVTLSTYYIGETEVTQELWQAVMGSNPSYFKPKETTSDTLKRPVEQVSWNDCQEFIRRLNQLTGKTFRLPTEAEWEFAARGGTKSRGYKYSGGDIIAVAWECNTSYDQGESSPDYGTHVVKTKQPNELGIYDMSGNVMEWCQDWDGKYSDGAQNNPKGPSTGSYRVVRGGAWKLSSWYCRASDRLLSFSPDRKYNYLGLRLVLAP